MRPNHSFVHFTSEERVSHCLNASSIRPPPLPLTGMLRPNGEAGLLATNTISEGETRSVGLEQLSSQATLSSAWSSVNWPGSASLAVAVLWIAKGTWSGVRMLDGVPVDSISPTLSAVTSVDGAPNRLRSNQEFAAKGSSIQGVGFLISPDEKAGNVAFEETLQEVGRAFHDHRTNVMRVRDEGLTKVYNRFHERKELDDDVQKHRELHVKMDQAVATAYGWTDLDLGHDFHETKQGIRFTISEPARREVLQRLLKLNHERYAEEVAQGLHDKKKGERGGERGA